MAEVLPNVLAAVGRTPPVFERGYLVGWLSESALFQKTGETPDVLDLTVGALLEPPLPTVGPERRSGSGSQVAEVFTRGFGPRPEKLPRHHHALRCGGAPG